MQLTQLEYLMAVEKYGSISRAARELYTSQSSISTSIKTLETELGVQLLKRRAKGVQLTAEGQYILENVRMVDHFIKNIRSVRNEVSGKIRGMVTAGGSGYCCMNILGNTAIQLKDSCPDISVALRGGNLKQILRELCEGTMDLGLFQVNHLNEKYIQAEIEYKQLTCKEVLKTHLVIGVSSQHPLYGKEQIALEELMPYEIVTGFSRAEDLIYWPLFCEMQKLGYKQSITCLGDVGISRLYAMKRNCVQLVPKISLNMTNSLYSCPLYPIEIQEQCELKYFLVYKEEMLSKAQKMFIDELWLYLESYVNS